VSSSFGTIEVQLKDHYIDIVGNVVGYGPDVKVKNTDDGLYLSDWSGKIKAVCKQTLPEGIDNFTFFPLKTYQAGSPRIYVHGYDRNDPMRQFLPIRVDDDGSVRYTPRDVLVPA